MRTEAELNYAQNLYKIADRNPESSIKIGLLGKEVESFKQDCLSKAKAAEELAQNIRQDCEEALLDLVTEQERDF
jgi:hypothetical protein